MIRVGVLFSSGAPCLTTIAYCPSPGFDANVSLQQCAKAAKTYWEYDPRTNRCFINPYDFKNPGKRELTQCEKNHHHCRISGNSKCTLEIGVTRTSTTRLDKWYPMNYEGCHFSSPLLKLGEV